MAALDRLHLYGILHRDIKPENILIDEDGGCVLADLGLARFWSNQSPPSELEYQFGGTDAYLAPEQWKGQRYSCKVDIWQLACVLIEFISRRRFPWTEELGVDMAVASQSEIARAVRGSLECLIYDRDAYSLLKWVSTLSKSLTVVLSFLSDDRRRA